MRVFSETIRYRIVFTLVQQLNLFSCVVAVIIHDVVVLRISNCVLGFNVPFKQ